MTPEQFSSIFQNWFDVVFLVEPDSGNIIAANRAVSQLGYTPEEVTGKSIATLMPGESLDVFFEMLRNAPINSRALDFLRFDGSSSPMDVSCMVADEYRILHLRNVNARKSLEDALKQAQERYEHLAATVTDYFYSVRVENRFPVETRHSPTCTAVTGYAQEDFISDPYLWIKMVFESDRDLVRRQAENILQGRELMCIQHRIVRKDGVVRWVSNTPIPTYDTEGRLVGYDGLVKDITARVESDEGLRRMATVIEQSHDAIIITDKNAIIQYVNASFERSMGWRRHEILGKKTSILSSGQHAAQFFRIMWETITRGETWTGQIICKCKDGSFKTIDSTITPVCDDKGVITNFVSIRRDVTA